MSQHDMVLDNAAGAAFRADLNNALLALAGNSSGSTAPATTYPYQFWADTTTGMMKVRNAANSAWLIVGTLASDYLGNVPQSNLQAQTYTAFTTGGAGTAFTLTPTPAITANTTNQRFRVKFHVAAGTTPTLAVSGLTALNLKYKDSAGTKQAITATQVPINWVSDVENDGTDWVVLDVPPSAAASETVAGLLEIATAAEAQAFTANKAIDGAKLAAAMQGANQSLLFNGYQKLPGGLIIQWGNITNSATPGNATLVTFPIVFPNAVRQLVVSSNVNSTSVSAAWYDSQTPSGFNMRSNVDTSNASYIAIGN